MATKLISQPLNCGKIQENNNGQIFGLEGTLIGFGKMRLSCSLGVPYIPNPDPERPLWHCLPSTLTWIWPLGN